MILHYVILRTEYTQTVVAPLAGYATENDAIDAVYNFNRTSQDDTWNAVRAYYYTVNTNKKVTT